MFFFCLSVLVFISCGEEMKVLLRSSLPARHSSHTTGPFAYHFVEPVQRSDESEVPLGEEYDEPSVK